MAMTWEQTLNRTKALNRQFNAPSPTARPTSLTSWRNMNYGYDPLARPTVTEKVAETTPLPASYVSGASNPYMTFGRTNYRYEQQPAPVTTDEIMKAYLNAYNKAPVTFEIAPDGRTVATRSMPMWDLPSEMANAPSEYSSLFYNPTAAGGQRRSLTTRFILPQKRGNYTIARNTPTTDLERYYGYRQSTRQNESRVNPTYAFSAGGLRAPTRGGIAGFGPTIANNTTIDYSRGQAYAPPAAQVGLGTITTGQQYSPNVSASMSGVNRFRFQPNQTQVSPWLRRRPWQQLYY